MIRQTKKHYNILHLLEALGPRKIISTIVEAASDLLSGRDLIRIHENGFPSSIICLTRAIHILATLDQL